MKTLPGFHKPLYALVAQFLFSSILLAQPPTITSFTPETGYRGKTVTITGTNFNATAANNVVYFGATKASVTTASATQLVVTVPLGATCKPIAVLNTTTGLSATSKKIFTITLPPYTGSDFTAASFNAATAANQGNLLRGIVVADFDGDGKADVAGYSSTSNVVSVSRNTSTTSAISFAAKVDLALQAGATGRLLTTGDVDNDGKIDIVIGSTNATTKGLYVFRNTSPATGNISFVRVDVAADNNLIAFAVGDLDGDGKPEIVASNGAGSVLSVYKNNSTPGTLTAASLVKTNFIANTPGGGVAIGDIDGDGKPEILTADQGGMNLSIFRNTTTNGTIDAASFAAKVDYSTGTAGFHYTVSVADLDGDGKPDIVVPQNGANTVSVFRNNSISGTINASSLDTRVDLALTASSFGGDVADLDGDGKMDIIAASSSRMVIFRNKATSGSLTASSFAAGVEYTADAGAGASPNALAIGDINSDGKLDVVPSIPTSPYSFTVLQNALSTTLPLHLLSVKAYRKGSNVAVEWTTTNESNLDRYDIERSPNGQQFTVVGGVAAKNTTNLNTYTFLDATPLNATAYYRVRSLGRDGEVVHSAIIKLGTGSTTPDIAVYPNPVTGSVITLQLSNVKEGSYQLTLRNAAGQVVLQKTLQHGGGTTVGTITLPDNLGSGMYGLTLSSKDSLFTQQLIKN